MLVSFQDRKINFHIDAPASKSIYHRELIVRFLLGDTSHLAVLDNDNEDVRATKACLSAPMNRLRKFTFPATRAVPRFVS